MDGRVAGLRDDVRRGEWVPTAVESAVAARMRMAVRAEGRDEVPIARVPPAVRAARRDLPEGSRLVGVADVVADRLGGYPHEQVCAVAPEDSALLDEVDELLADVEGFRLVCERLRHARLSEEDRLAVGRVYTVVFGLARPLPGCGGTATEVAALVEATLPGTSPIVAEALTAAAGHLRASTGAAMKPFEPARVAGEMLAVLEEILLSQPLEDAEQVEPATVDRELREAERDLMRGVWTPDPNDAQRLLEAMQTHPAWAMAHRGDDPEVAHQAMLRVWSSLVTSGILAGVEARLARLCLLAYTGLHDPDQGGVFSPLGGLLAAIATGDTSY